MKEETMPSDNNLRGLHSTLKENGYTPPEFEQFAADMQDDNNLKEVHATLIKEGYTPPEYDQFRKEILGVDSSTSQPTPSPASSPSVSASDENSPASGGLSSTQSTAQSEEKSAAGQLNNADQIENAYKAKAASDVAASKKRLAESYRRIHGFEPTERQLNDMVIREEQFNIDALQWSQRQREEQKEEHQKAQEAREAYDKALKASNQAGRAHLERMERESPDMLVHDPLKGERDAVEMKYGDQLSPQAQAWRDRGKKPRPVMSGEAQASNFREVSRGEDPEYDTGIVTNKDSGNYGHTVSGRKMAYQGSDPEDIYTLREGIFNAGGTSGSPYDLDEVTVTAVSGRSVEKRIDEMKRLDPEANRKAYADLYDEAKKNIEGEIAQADRLFEEWKRSNREKVREMSPEQLAVKREEFGRQVEMERQLAGYDRRNDAIVREISEREKEIKEEVWKECGGDRDKFLYAYRAACDGDDILQALLLERRNLDKAKERKETAERDARNGSVTNYLEGVGEKALDIVLNPFGITELKDTYSPLYHIKRKIDNKEALSKEEQRALETFYLKENVEGSTRLSGARSAGEFTAGLAECAMEFGLNPASGLTRKTLMKIAKDVGEDSVELVLRNSPGLLRKLGARAENVGAWQLTKNMAKITGAALAEGATVTVTTQAPKNIGQIVDRSMYRQDEDGNYYQAESGVKAAGKVAVSSAGTNSLFMLPVNFGSRIVEAVTKGKNTTTALKDLKLPFGNPVDAYMKMKGGEVVSVLTGDMLGRSDMDPGWDSVFSAASNGELVTSLLVTELVTGGIKGAVSNLKGGGLKRNMRRRGRKAEQAALAAGNEFSKGNNVSEWNEIVGQLNSDDPKEFGKGCKRIEENIKSGRYTKQEGAAAVDFVKALGGYIGAQNKYEQWRKKGENMLDMYERIHDEAYSEGENLTEAAQIRDLRESLRLPEEMEEELSSWVQMIDETEYAPVSLHLIETDESLSPEQKTALRDYVLNRARWEGYEDSAAARREEELQESDRDIDRMTNQDGNVHRVKSVASGEAVYIVSGTLSTYHDEFSGEEVVNRSKSSDVIYCYDPKEGKVKAYSPSELSYDMEPVPASALKEHARKEISKRHADEDAALYGEEKDREDTARISEEDAIDDSGFPSGEESDKNTQYPTLSPEETGFQVDETFLVPTDGDVSREQRAIVIGNNRREVTVWTGDPISSLSKRDPRLGGYLTSIPVEEIGDWAIKDSKGNYKDYVHPNKGRFNVEDRVPTDSGNGRMGIEPEALSQAQTAPRTEQEDLLPEQTIPRTEAAIAEGQTKGGAERRNALSRIPVDEGGLPLFTETDAVTGWDAIVELTKGDEKDARELAESERNEARANYENIRKQTPREEKPNFDGKNILQKQQEQERVRGVNKERQERYAKALSEAQRKAEAWDAIVGEHDRREQAKKAAEAERRREEEEARKAEAEARFAAQQAEKAQKEEEARRTGPHNVGEGLKKQWAEAKKIEGPEGVFIMPDGTQLKGRWMLVEAGSVAASHDPENGFSKREGFPVDKNGNTVNDRDYESDRDAQGKVIRMGDKFDARAIQSPVVVSEDGIVLSGNNRTMSGDIAAKRGTDGEYVSYLHSNDGMFKAEEVGQFRHPRKIFVTSEKLPYTAETFARFNQSETKSQNSAEKTIKQGKTVSDKAFRKIVGIASEYENLRSFLTDPEAAKMAIGILEEEGVINDNEKAQYFSNGRLSEEGELFIEKVLVGKSLEESPEAVRELMEMPGVRKRVVSALLQISDSKTLRNGYDIGEELVEAISLVYRAKESERNSPQKVYTDGKAISPFGRQEGLFVDELGEQSVRDATVLMLADLLNHSNLTELRKVLEAYVVGAREASNGSGDIFSGEPERKEDILKRYIDEFKNGNKRERERAEAGYAGQRQEQARGARNESGGTDRVAEAAATYGRGGEGEGRAGAKNTASSETDKINFINPVEMPEAEKAHRGELLDNATAIRVEKGQIIRTPEMSARRAAEFWWDDNVGGPVLYDTEVGEVEINRNSVESSLAHRYGQAKLDAITSLVDGFENAVYLGTMPDFTRQEGVNNHFFAYPIMYDGKRCYVFCRAMQDANKNRLYVHEVFVGDNIRKGDTLQTAASQPHGGIALYKDILANVLETVAKTEPQQPNSAVSGDSSLSAAEHSGTSSAEPNGKSTVSDSKVNTLLSEKQEIEGESSENGDGSRASGGNSSAIAGKIAEAEGHVNLSPTDAQKEAGNYRKGHVRIGTFDITIENPKGSVRRGTDAKGKRWESTMSHSYGYIRGTRGVDGDHIDVFLSSGIEGWKGEKVFVVDQYNQDGTFDEHKVMFGFNDRESAFDGYLSNYEKGWENGRRLEVSEVSLNDFQKWIESSTRKQKPFAEYRSLDGKITGEEQAERRRTIEKEGTRHGRRYQWSEEWSEYSSGLTGLTDEGLEREREKLNDAIRNIIGEAVESDLGREEAIRRAGELASKRQAVEAEIARRRAISGDGGVTGVANDVAEVYGGSLFRDEDFMVVVPAHRQRSLFDHEPQDSSTSTNKSISPGDKPAPQEASKPEDKPAAQSAPSAESMAGGKGSAPKVIEDFGEKIAGARKDMLTEFSKGLGDVTEEALVKMPLGKAVKRPDFGKMVDKGAMTGEEAAAAEAMWQTVNLDRKPVASRSNRRKIQEWAQRTAGRIKRLQDFLNGDAETRRSIMEKMSGDSRFEPDEATRAAEQERYDAIRDMNRHRREFDPPLFTPDEAAVNAEVMKRIGTRPGDKVKLGFTIRPNSTHERYEIIDAGGSRVYGVESGRDLDTMIEKVALLTRIQNGDTEVVYPESCFTVIGKDPVMEKSGEWKVGYLRRNSHRYEEIVFPSREEAEKAKEALEKKGCTAKLYEVSRRTGEYGSYRVAFTNPLTRERIELEREYTSRAEAEEGFREGSEMLSEEVNGIYSGKSGSTSAKSHYFTGTIYREGRRRYVVAGDKPGYPGRQEVVKEFESRAEAEAWLKENAAALEEHRRKGIEDMRRFTFFEVSDRPREGKDRRGGKDVTPERFSEEFGFRGVQFGNWTNGRDRQAALNEAYDSFHDLAEVLGVSPRALSLNGELGLSFGARGSGNANAHYEPKEVVINLTKTRGAGSLAHEWWHALDNYMMRQKGNPLLYATSHIDANSGHRGEVVKAFRALSEAVRRSAYGERSMRHRNPEYWGSDIEMTARLFGEWIVSELSEKGGRNHFLSRGIDPEVYDSYRRLFYELYKGRCELSEEEPVSFEEYRKREDSLVDFPYPTPEELSELSPYMRGVFEALEETSGEKGGVILSEPEIGYGREGTENGLVGRPLSEKESSFLIGKMESDAQEAPVLELTHDNWIAQFGEEGKVDTPVGVVKMGDNQYYKLAQPGRNGKFGMIKPTLQNPDVIVEDYRPAINGISERDTSLVFIRTFRKNNGERYYHFTSVTVRKDGREVVISSQERSSNRISKLLQEGKVVWIKDGSLHPIAQVGKSVSLSDSSSLTPTDNRTTMLGINSPTNRFKGPESSDGFAADSTAPITPKATPDNLDSQYGSKDNAYSSERQQISEENSGLSEPSMGYKEAEQLSLFDSDFGKEGAKKTRQLSLFDSDFGQERKAAHTEERGREEGFREERDPALIRAEEAVDRLTDDYTEAYSQLLRAPEDEIPSALEEYRYQLRDELTESLKEYYLQKGNDAADAAVRARETLGNIEAQISLEEWRRAKAEREEGSPSTDRLRAEEGESGINIPSPSTDQGIRERRTASGELLRFRHDGWLPDLEEGEFCHFEQRFQEDGKFSFTGDSRIESADDVAYLLRSLEEYSREHSFAVMVKDGIPVVIHLGMGNMSGTVVDLTGVKAADGMMGGADKVWFVHNHPSGALQCSSQDCAVHRNLEMMLGDRLAGSVIIDTLRGEYGTFDGNRSTGEHRRPTSARGEETEAGVYSYDRFDRRVYDEEFDYSSLRQIRSSEDVAQLVSGYRLGGGKKAGVLVLNHSNRVVANLPVSHLLTSEEGIETVVNYAIRGGGDRVIIFSNDRMTRADLGKLKEGIKAHSGGSLTLLDVVMGESRESAHDNNLFRMAESKEDFDSMRERAVEERGIVMPGLSEKEMKVVAVPRHDFAGEKPIAQAKRWAKDNIVGEHELTDSEGKRVKYQISGKSIEKYLSSSAIEKSDNLGVHLSVLKNLPEVIENSIEAELHPSYNKENGIRKSINGYNREMLIHRFYGAVKMDGKIYRVKTTINEHRDSSTQVHPHSYEVTKIEVLPDNSKSTSTIGAQASASSREGTLQTAKLINKNGESYISGKELLRGVEKSYDPGVKLLEKSEEGNRASGGQGEGDNLSLATRDGNGAGIANGEKRIEELRQKAEETAGKLNTPIKIISREEAVALGHGDKKGWTDRRTGEVTVVAENHRSAGDIADTVIHEVVGHHGLRALYGNGEELDAFLDESYRKSSRRVQKEIDSRAEAMMERDRRRRAEDRGNGFFGEAEARVETERERKRYLRDATEEYAADLGMRIGEEGFEKIREEELTFWARLRGGFQRAVNRLVESLGFDPFFRWGDREWSYALSKSRENLRNRELGPDVFEAADDFLLRERSAFGRRERGERGERGEGERIERRERDRISRELFRDGDDEKDPEVLRKEMQLRISTVLTDAAAQMAEKHGESYEKRNEVRRRLGHHLNLISAILSERGGSVKHTLSEQTEGILKGGVKEAMDSQRDHDRASYRALSDMVDLFSRAGGLDSATQGEVRRLMDACGRSIGSGKGGFKAEANKVLNIIVGNHLRQSRETFYKLLKIRDSKVNAFGVEIQGKLDSRGQMIMKTLRENYSKKEKDFNAEIEKVRGAVSAARGDMARDRLTAELTGLEYARDYRETVDSYQKEREDLQRELQTLKEEHDSGVIGDKDYYEARGKVVEAMRQSKIRHADAYRSFVNRLAGDFRESAEGALSFREREKEQGDHIRHLANSDMLGVGAESQREKEVRNNAFHWLTRPMGSFEAFMKLFSRRSMDGHGMLEQEFIPRLNEASGREYLGVKEKQARLGEKVEEIFGGEGGSRFYGGRDSGESRASGGNSFARVGESSELRKEGKRIRKRDQGLRKSWVKLASQVRKMKLTNGERNVKVKFRNGDCERDYELGLGELMYIYAAGRSIDGSVKLHRMGITDAKLEEIKALIPDKLLELVDWVQKEFLVDCREEYNMVHERMFGAPMAANEHYIPLRIDKNSIPRDEDINNPVGQRTTSSVSTGAVVKRTFNSLPLDILHTNFFDVINDHIKEMEHWAAYSEVARDLNTLISHNRFKNQVKGMKSFLGNGEDLWESFVASCRIATGNYDKVKNDRWILGASSAMVAAKVSGRLYTAFKQLSSFPAYLAEANLLSLGKNALMIGESFEWARQNLPQFEKRWGGRMAGDEKLESAARDGKWMKKYLNSQIAKGGMWANTLVDACTVAMGAKAVYETKLKRYKEQGYSPEDARKKALADASNIYNKTQQSSEGAYLSEMQAERTFLSTMFTAYRNSPISYQRMLLESLRNIKRKCSRERREDMIYQRQQQIMREWGYDTETETGEYMGRSYEESEAMARKAAERDMRTSWKRDIMNVANFGLLMQLAWNVFGHLPYYIFGSDSEDKDEMLEDDSLHAVIGGWVEGLTGGDILSDGLNNVRNMVFGDEDWKTELGKQHPLFQDLDRLGDTFKYDWVAGANEVLNICIASGIGMAPSTLTDAAVAVNDLYHADKRSIKEWGLLMMRIAQIPQSQLDKIWLDEFDCTGAQAIKLSPAESARRYARYKVMKGYGFTGMCMSEEDGLFFDGAVNKRQEKIRQEYKKRIDKLWSKEENEKFVTISDAMEAIRKKEKSLEERADLLNDIEAQKDLEILYNDPQYIKYEYYKTMKPFIKGLADNYLDALTPEEAEKSLQTLIKVKKIMVEQLTGGEIPEERWEEQERMIEEWKEGERNKRVEAIKE